MRRIPWILFGVISVTAAAACGSHEPLTDTMRSPSPSPLHPADHRATASPSPLRSPLLGNLAGTRAPRGLASQQTVRLSPFAADPPSWFPLGPTPIGDGPTYGQTNVPAAGRGTVIVPNPSSPSEVWLGTATGGVWHTNNAQIADPLWIPVNGLQLPQSLAGPGGEAVSAGAMAMSIGALAVDGCSPASAGGGCTRVWIGTGENGIRRETFYGAGLFLQTPSPPPEIDPLVQVMDLRYGSVTRIALAPHAAGTVTNTLYMAVSSGVAAPGSEEGVTAPAPADGYGLYKTSDATNFTKLPVPGVSASLPSDVVIDPNDATGNTLLAGFMALHRGDTTAARGIFRSTDGGTTWCSINDNTAAGAPQCAGGAGLPAGNLVIANPPVSGQDEVLGHITLQFSQNVPGRVYALVGQCGQVADFGCTPLAFRSDDDGITWSPVPITLPSTDVTTSTASYGRYTHALAVVPGGTSANERILVGGIEMLSCSGEGGGCVGAQPVPCSNLDLTKCFASSVLQTHPDNHAIVFADPTNPNVIYNATDGGFYFSLDGGTSWTDGNASLTTSQFDSLAVFDHNLAGGLQDQGVGFFNGSRVWTDRQTGDGGDVVVYSFGPPATTVWVFTGQRAFPQRATGDPTAGTTTYLGPGGTGPTWPASAMAEVKNPSSGTLPTNVAFFPRLGINSVTHDLYFATIRVYKSTDTGNLRGSAWTDISPVLATPQGKVFPAIDTDNVITAIGVGDDGRVYAGTYIGDVWVSTPAPGLSSWTKVSGPGTGSPMPNLPVSSFAVQPGNSSTALVTFAGFAGSPNHVWQTVNAGGAWTAQSNGLVDTPANVVRFDSLGTLRLGTDVGLYTFDGTTWNHETGLPVVPVTAITSWPTGAGTQRVYAATHGRGTWVLTEPTVSTLEGWAMGAIWDVPIYGYGFTNTTGAPVPCTVSLVQTSGQICASGGVDVSVNDFGAGGTIEVDTNGQLQTTQPAPASTWDNKPVVWACNQGHCLNGTPIAQCNTDSVGNKDFLSEVIVDCGSAGTGTAQILGAPTLANPPSSSLLFDPPPDAPPSAPTTSATWTFNAVVSLTTNVGASLLCQATVTVNQDAADEDVVSATAAAINANAQCQAAGIIATANVFPALSTGEDPGDQAPSVTVRSTASGSQVFVTFQSAPGAATGLCFNLQGMGNPALHQTAIMQTVVQTAASGAAGGTLRFVEDTDIGVCRRDIATTPGMTANQVAAAIGDAFKSVSAPGPGECLARNDALDVEVGHLGENPGTLYTVISHKMELCSFDPGVGFVVGPDGVTVPASAEACVVGTDSLRIAERVATSGGIATASLDMEPGATANGGANIDNVGGGQVRISGATIQGTVLIAGPAPSTANGELLNGGRIVGTVLAGAGLPATLPTQAVSPGTTAVTVNSGDPARTLAPGSYASVTFNGSTVTFVAGSYEVASLVINAGTTVRFDTSGGPITVAALGAITVNGGTLTAGNPAEVAFYSASTASNAVAINAGITTLPGSIAAPSGGVTIGSRILVQGCVRGRTVDIEPDTTVAGTASIAGCADGQREGFVDLAAYPNIAGCSGGFTLPGVMPTNPGTAPACPTIATHDTVTPACGRMAGDDGLNPNGNGCDVADLCATGWHVCTGSADITSHSPTGCAGATMPGDPDLFFVSRQSSSGCGACATGTRTSADCNASSCATGCAETSSTSNDVFGCGNFGATSTLNGCGPIDVTGHNLCAAFSGSSWSCNDDGSGLCEAYVLVHQGPDFGGALCCRN